MTEQKKYAEALFLLCEEEGILKEVKEDMECVNAAITESPEYAAILDTPALPKDERLALCEKAFGGLNEYVLNVVKMLCSSHGAYAFPRIYKEFEKLYNDKCGIVEVEAVSAVALTESEKAKLERKLEAKLSKTVSIRNTVDAGILGGLIIRYNSLQLDGSVKTRLEKIERDLREVAI